MDNLFIGFDCHKKTHYCVIIDVQGEEIDSFELSSSKEEIIKCFIKLRKLKDHYNLKVGIEGSRCYGKNLARTLSQKLDVFEVNSALTCSRRKTTVGYGKSDPLDALLVARIVRDEWRNLPKVNFKEDIESLTKLVVRRKCLVKFLTQEYNRLHAELLEFRPNYQDIGNIRSLWVREYWRKEAHKVKKQFDDKDGELEIVCLNIIDIINSINHAQRQIKKIEKYLKWYQTQEVKILQSLQGVNIITGSTIMSRIRDINNFESEAKLACFAGLSPVTYSSGSGSFSKMNRRGDRELNYIMSIVSLTALRHNPVSRAYYLKKISEGKTKKEARRFLARRLIKIIYSMLKNLKEYDPNHYPFAKKIENFRNQTASIQENLNSLQVS